MFVIFGILFGTCYVIESYAPDLRQATPGLELQCIVRNPYCFNSINPPLLNPGCPSITACISNITNIELSPRKKREKQKKEKKIEEML